MALNLKVLLLASASVFASAAAQADDGFVTR